MNVRINNYILAFIRFGHYEACKKELLRLPFHKFCVALAFFFLLDFRFFHCINLIIKNAPIRFYIITYGV